MTFSRNVSLVAFEVCVAFALMALVIFGGEVVVVFLFSAIVTDGMALLFCFYGEGAVVEPFLMEGMSRKIHRLVDGALAEALVSCPSFFYMMLRRSVVSLLTGAATFDGKISRHATQSCKSTSNFARVRVVV